LSSETGRAKLDAFYYLYQTIFQSYQLESHAEMNAFDFYYSDSRFAQTLFDQIVNTTIGAIMRNIIEIKRGSNKPVPLEAQYHRKEHKDDWKMYGVIYDHYSGRKEMDELYNHVLNLMKNNHTHPAVIVGESVEEEVNISESGHKDL
jgi:hypothetical protein